MSPAIQALPYPRISFLSFHWLMAALVSLLLGSDILLARLTGNAALSTDLADLAPDVLLLFIPVAGYCYWRKMERSFEFTMSLFWAFWIVIGSGLQLIAAGHSGFPLADSRLAAIDHAMGFSTPAVVASVSHYPAIQAFLAFCYRLMPVMVLAAIAVPILSGRTIQTRRFLMACLISGTITAVIFTFAPAAGPWVAGAYHPSHSQAGVEAYLHLLKEGASAATLAANPAGGMVSFPSGHVMLALFPVFALWPIRYTRIPMAVIAMLICVSTVTTGWHYGIDVLGGIAVAVLAQSLALRRNLNHDPAESR